MLATILKSTTATKVSIQIMDAFVMMRKYISSNLLEQRYINNMVLEHNNEIKLLQITFEKLAEKKLNNEIYFNGQIYDAYSKILDLIIEAKEELIIIDNYADKTVLDMIRRLKINVMIITKSKSSINQVDLAKYNKQYNNLMVFYDNTFHDRYLIVDKEVVYHLGASVNHAGSKTFSINQIEEDDIIKLLVQKTNLILEKHNIINKN